MDGLIDRYRAALDTSDVAGKITSIVGSRYEQAVLGQDEDTAERFDVSLDTIYFAALLLTVVNGSGEARSRGQVIAALDTVSEVIGELRQWIESHAS